MGKQVDKILNTIVNIEAEGKYLELWNADHLVCQCNFDTGQFNIVKPDRLPFSLKYRLIDIPDIENYVQKVGVLRAVKDISNNKEYFVNWLASRTS